MGAVDVRISQEMEYQYEKGIEGPEIPHLSRCVWILAHDLGEEVLREI